MIVMQNLCTAFDNSIFIYYNSFTLHSHRLSSRLLLSHTSIFVSNVIAQLTINHTALYILYGCTNSSILTYTPDNRQIKPKIMMKISRKSLYFTLPYLSGYQRHMSITPGKMMANSDKHSAPIIEMNGPSFGINTAGTSVEIYIHVLYIRKWTASHQVKDLLIKLITNWHILDLHPAQTTKVPLVNH